MIANPLLAAEVLTRLRIKGIELSIDDFGTGYSSLAYLKRFPVQRLKVDRAFIRDLGTDEDGAAIVRSIVNLAHGLKLAVVAEGPDLVVHVHPTAANCCRNLEYGTAPGSMEYGTDTTRAIIGVTFNGDTTRCPDVRFIWSHAGGSAPFLAGRPQVLPVPPAGSS